MMMLSKSFFSFASILIGSSPSSIVNALGADGKCRILSLRGGGVHGAFEVGVLQAIVDIMPKDEIKYDYVGGVSVGALNASIMASFAPGDEKKAVEKMASVYKGRATAELFDFHKPRLVAPFRESSLADNAKMKHLLEDTLGDRPFKRCLSILSCDLNSGQVIIFDETMN